MPWRLFEIAITNAAKSSDQPSIPRPNGILPTLLADKKDSGFFDAVAALRSKIRKAEDVEQEVLTTVMRLADQLCGLKLDEIPDRL